MKILHVYKDYFPIVGGIENHIQWLAEAQVAKGHSVEVLVTNPSNLPGEEIINGVRVYRAARLTTVASTPLSLTFPLRLLRLQPDITHLQFPYPVGEVSQWLATLLPGKRPFIVSYQSDVVKQQAILRFYRPLMEHVLSRADRILASSPRYGETSPTLQRFAARCRSTPLGIDPTPFAPAAEDQVASRTGRRILFMGRHRYYKGVDTLLRALVDLPEAELWIGGDGPERDTWDVLCTELGLGNRVRFLGNVSAAELPDLYRAADIFCLPSNSRAEAFGIVLLEAMASGLPCVTTELGTGTSFVVRHEETGLVVPPSDPPALAAALGRLLGDRGLRRRMGTAGRERLLAEFTIDKMVDRVLAHYAEILG